MNLIYNIAPEIKIGLESINPPVIITVQEFTEESYTIFRKDFNNALNTNQPFIPIIIDSYGGQAYSLLAMIDIINASTKPVYTIAQSKIMSCAAILFSAGERRYISPNATVLIHDVASRAKGKIGELLSDVAETKRLDDKVYKLLDDNTNNKPGFFKSEVHKRDHADWYLTPETALKIKLATKIGIPTFTVNISCTYTIK